MQPLVLGAVAYDPKVVTIWDGFAAWFAEHDLPFDYVLFTNYERQVEAHLAGVVDVAWSSPLAWVQTVRAARGVTPRALVMRDTDQDLRSVIVVRADGPRALSELRRVGVGAADSPQATLIPLDHIAEAGAPVEVVRHDLLLGKHGDHVGGEREAARALLRGEVDACCILDANLLAFGRDGTFPIGSARILDRTGPFDHCTFTALHDHAALPRFVELLLGMSYADPRVRPLFDLEGLTEWRPGRETGFALLNRAVDRFGTVDAWLRARS